MLRTAAGVWSAQEASAIIIAEQSSQETHKRRNITGLHTYERCFTSSFPQWFCPKYSHPS